ncbi:site-specific DNA-methyltransferase [Sphingopyxis granuli]|uniref:site-specific DNA-methyltransferase n=1 Tax=Sphingopyxis granuli TaxID=267128 RepID=UPI001F53143D|nr:site-specific DNA-methyltransferase [Sphingopyxis granuli]UNK78049.1 site-specific DNA-methyltransferase [Sphingopyxis granuli]
MSDGQDKLDLGSDQQEGRIEEYKFEPIKGYPMLNWRGKRPFTSTQFYPAQLKEVHGPEVDGWRNKVFWGDNLQVMSHLLKEFRSKIDLVYIDPPFDSKADYKKRISLRGKELESHQSSFEEKQYSDIWMNDEYLQYIFERLVLCRELMSDSASIFVHCDSQKNYLIRCLLDEVFGPQNFVNEIIWKRKGGSANPKSQLGTVTDTIFWYSKSSSKKYIQEFTKDSDEAQKYIAERFNRVDPATGKKFMDSPVISPSPRPNLKYEYRGFPAPPTGWSVSKDIMEQWDAEGRLMIPEDKSKRIRRKIFLDEYKGQPVQNLWTDIFVINSQAAESLEYPTQKPESLIRRIIGLTTEKGDLVFDGFMGSGTTQAVASKLRRRFIGADINLGAIQTTTRRLVNLLEDGQSDTGFESFNVNNYDLFRNPVEAKELLIEALEVQALEGSRVFDGEKDGRMVKIMPINRIATKADLGELVASFDQKIFQRRQDENPRQPVEKILLVCMGHEPDLKAELELQAKPFKIDVEVVDILRDKSQLEFKRDAEAKLAIRDGELAIENFYPMNLLQKLSLQQEQVGEWRELVDSVMVDWNYDGAVLQPAVVDVPGKDELVVGRYKVPADAGTIRVKITDLLSESWEGNIDG